MKAADRGALLLATGVIALLLIFAAGPVLVLVGRSLFTLRGELFSEILSPGGLRALGDTLKVSGGAAALAFLLGAPLSFLLFRTDLPLRGPLGLLFTLPTAIPPFIWGMGWVSLANPRVGYLNRLFGEGSFNIYSVWGICFVLGVAGLPLVVLAGKAALSRIDSSLEEAARVGGASPVRALAFATLPLALPSMLAGAGLVFLFAASAFGVPYLLGASASPPVSVLTTRIYGQVLMGGSDSVARAVGLSSVLLLLAAVVLVINQVLGRMGRVRLASGKGVKIRLVPLGRWRTAAAMSVSLLGGVLVILPLVAVFLTSVQRTFGSRLALSELTFSHWGTVLASERTLRAAGWSLALAVGAGAVVCLVGLLVAVVRRKGGRLSRATETLAVWPYAVPGTVLAMALVVVFARDLQVILAERVAFTLVLADTAWILLVAYGAKHLAFGARYTTESLAQVDPSLGEAARLCGAGPARAFVDAVLPMLKPALATAFLLTFLTSATEITMSVLLLPTGKDLLGTMLFELTTYADPAAAAVLACAFVLLVVGCLATLRLMGRAAPGGGS